MNITLHLTTNDKTPKHATVEFNGQTITIDGETIKKFFIERSHYGAASQDSLYAHTAKSVYLFTMTEGFLDIYNHAAQYEPITPDPAHVIVGIVNLFDIA